MIENRYSIEKDSKDSGLHLYLAWGCPFCHRALAALAITGLLDKVSITWMKNIKTQAGWEMEAADDPVYHVSSIKEAYQRATSGSATRFSVPLMVEKSTGKFVSDESSEIMRYIANGFGGTYEVAQDIAPVSLRSKIDKLNEELHERISRKVYLIGLATNQEQYEEAVTELFEALDERETILAKQPYLLGENITESDLYLLATLLRFDSVYFLLFKCNKKTIASYPALSRYMNSLMSHEALKKTYKHEKTKEHYYKSIMHVRGEVRELNPSGIIPVDIEV